MTYKAAPSREFYAKLAERVLWTAVQAGVGVIAVVVTEIPTVWAPVIATVLSVVKGFLARKVGDPQSPATLPWGF